ncbi:MAG: IPT/TIG domain-containing protein, partial [Saprospiraceae bacterium]|nr:IPT/TIG domain-containing protein [Saprospiraceae bacterium]
MKIRYLSLLFFSVFYTVHLTAQPWAEVSSTVAPNFYRMKTSGDAVLNAVKTQKGKGFKAFKRWEKYWDQRVFPDGSFPPANLVQKNWELYQTEKSLSALIPGSSWTSLGPNSSSGGYAGIGRINRLTFHPTNTNIIFACTAGGGLWKTSNGGSSWIPLTDNLASIGTSGLVINPTNTNIMYLATGDGDGSDTYSYGVLKSIDGGITWNTTGLTFSPGTVIYKLQPHATDPNILLAGTNGGLYRTANGGTSWTKVVASGQFYDIETLSASNMVAVTKGGFYRSTDGGATWVLVKTITSTGRIALAVSASNPNFVAALVSNTSNGFKGFYASVDGGLTYTLRSSTPNVMGWETNGSDSGGQAWYDICIAVSPTDVNQIIVGGVNTWKTTNGGTSWSIMTNWYQTSTVPAMHADQHDLIFLNSTTIYAANDGGIYRSTNNGLSWTDLTNGMSISQLYRASAAQTDTRVIAGLQDNGTKLRSTTGTWSDEIGGDGMDCAIDPTNATYMYGTLYYGDIQRSTNGGSSWKSITPSTGTDGAWVTPVLLDPVNPAIIYMGYTDLMKSTDRGTTWSKISAGQTAGKFISNIAVAPSNPLVIYISWGTAMAKTINGGTSWTTITTPISSQISSLLVDPTNPNNLYATYSNFTASSKVYFSNNGGTSWTNISGTLPNIPANKIIYQTGSNGALYLGMDVGIYYRDNTQTDWSLYNSGLPNVEIFDLEIRYIDKKLIAATYGRGLWESPLYVGTPLSVPVVSSFSPTSATKGNTVTISGSNFTGATAVSFGGSAATSFTVVSPTNITAVVGNGNSGNVSVSNASGTGTLSGFTYINTSTTITSFTPTSGKTGQEVTITGTNLTGATAVSFGGTAATTFTVVSATSINATVAAGASGVVSVTTASGTGTLAGFTYLPPPTITSFSPTSAGTGQTVTITGTNFSGTTAVSFGGTASTSFTVVSATSITAVVAAGTTGAVSVTTSNGNASRAGFTFTAATSAPTITSFTPTSGKTGQVVTITGTNFTGATAVSFGGTAATTFTVVSATSINANAGAGASGSVSVTTVA